MAVGSTIYRVSMDLSDVTRGVYESLQFRTACHPSESPDRVVARILAYALLYEPNLEFGKGVSSDEPALWSHDLTGMLLHWVDVGTPSADRIHSASKQAQRVSIICHRNEDTLAREMQKRKIHGADAVDVWLLDPDLVAQMADTLERDSRWTLVHTDGDINVTIDDRNFSMATRKIPLPQ